MSRPRLIERLDEGLRLGHRLTLVCAPAGFGKTTLLSEWAAACRRLEPKVRVAWLSLDEGDNDPARFLAYFIAALQMVNEGLGQAATAVLQSSQSPPVESILTALINEVAALPGRLAIILDDYHLIDARSTQNAIAFLLKHQPPNMYLIIATRSDPFLPLSRLRARSQTTEIRADDLRFTPQEASAFLNQVMGLALSGEEVGALGIRTEGWIAGLLLAALSMRDRKQRDDAAAFISSFTGNDRYVVDFLVDEVLAQRPEGTRDFLLQTSILDRMSGPLCDAVTGSKGGQRVLEKLDQANLFIVPLDYQRRWYRYHRLFADLLRPRLEASATRQ